MVNFFFNFRLGFFFFKRSLHTEDNSIEINRKSKRGSDYFSDFVTAKDNGRTAVILNGKYRSLLELT